MNHLRRKSLIAISSRGFSLLLGVLVVTFYIRILTTVVSSERKASKGRIGLRYVMVAGCGETEQTNQNKIVLYLVTLRLDGSDFLLNCNCILLHSFDRRMQLQRIHHFSDFKFGLIELSPHTNIRWIPHHLLVDSSIYFVLKVETLI